MLHCPSICYHSVSETLFGALAGGGNSFLHSLAGAPPSLSPPRPHLKPTHTISAQMVKQDSHSLNPPMRFPSFAPGLLCVPRVAERNPYLTRTNLWQALLDGNGYSPISFNPHFTDEATCPGSYLKQGCAQQTLTSWAFAADVRWVVCNWPWGEYLHHGNWQMLPFRVFPL